MQVMKSPMQVEASASASASASSAAVTVKAFEMVQQMASSNAVVVFSCSDCCMSTVVKRLLFSLGVGPTIVELDEHASGEAMEAALYQLSGTLQAVPAVFVGGKFLGGVQTLMASHINGSLIPLLKEAGALWL